MKLEKLQYSKWTGLLGIMGKILSFEIFFGFVAGCLLPAHLKCFSYRKYSLSEYMEGIDVYVFLCLTGAYIIQKNDYTKCSLMANYTALWENIISELFK